MKTSAEIREEIGRQLARAEALNALADEREDKSLNDDERTELDKILGKGQKGAKDFVPGVINRLEDDLDRASKFEAKVEEYSQKRNSSVKPQQGDGGAPAVEDDGFSSRLAKVKVPLASRYRHTGLKAFSEKLFNNSLETAERAAYVSGQFILATIGQSDVARQWCKDHGIDIRFRGALKENDNALGGFLVPAEMERSIINLREERGVLRREATVMPMGSDTLMLPRRSAGITSYFVGDNAAGTASTPTTDQVQLSVKKLMAFTSMSSEISEDAVISIADWVTSEIAYSFADMEDKCGFTADGSSTYGGMTGLKSALAAGSVYTATGHTDFSALTLSDFHGMTAKLPLYAQQNAKWYISKAGFSASMERLMAAGGGNTWQSLADGRNVPRFLGYDVVFTQVMNSALTSNTGVAGAVFFGDLKQGVKLGSRRGLAIDTSKDFYFDTDQIAIKGTERFDVVAHEIGTSTAAGSIIGLTFG